MERVVKIRRTKIITEEIAPYLLGGTIAIFFIIFYITTPTEIYEGRDPELYDWCQRAEPVTFEEYKKCQINDKMEETKEAKPLGDIIIMSIIFSFGVWAAIGLVIFIVFLLLPKKGGKQKLKNGKTKDPRRI